MIGRVAPPPFAGGGAAGAPSQQEIRARNLESVLTAVSQQGLRTRNSIAEATGLHKSSVTSLVDELTKLGVLRLTTPEPNGASGRPPALIEVVPSVAVGLGLEIRADALVAFVADLAGRSRYRAVIHRLNRIRRIESVLTELAAEARGALLEIERQQLSLSGVTIAVPPELGALELGVERFFEQPGVSVAVEDTRTLAALAEVHDPRGCGLVDGLFVIGDGGVGARVLSGGAVMPGYAEGFGRIAVDARGEGLEARTRRATLLDAAGLGDGALSDLLEHAQAGDPRVIAAVEDCGRWLGVGLASVLNLLAPPTVVLGGDFAVLAPWLTSAVEEELRMRVFARTASWPAVTVSQVGPDAAARGAAVMAVRRVSPVRAHAPA